MPRFAANLDFLFTELPFARRFAAASAAGFDAVELLFPCRFAAADIRGWLDEAGLELALINTPVPDWGEGGRGVAALPGEEGRFRAEFELALGLAEQLQPRHIHVLSGRAGGADAREHLVRNLAWAAGHAPAQSLTIEPINAHDMPGYFLDRFDLAQEILAEVGAGNLHLQFDTYHAQRIDGDVLSLWRQYGRYAAHVQVADAPGRHEPGTGSIDFPAFFAQLDADRYGGFVSAEYHPAGRTPEGLFRLSPWLSARG